MLKPKPATAVESTAEAITLEERSSTSTPVSALRARLSQGVGPKWPRSSQMIRSFIAGRRDSTEEAVSPPGTALPSGFPVGLLRAWPPGTELEQLRDVQFYMGSWVRHLGNLCRLPHEWDCVPYEDVSAPLPPSDLDWEAIRPPLERVSAIRVDWGVERNVNAEHIRRQHGVPFTLYELLNSSRRSLDEYMTFLRFPADLKAALLQCWVLERTEARKYIDKKRAKEVCCPRCRHLFRWPPGNSDSWVRKVRQSRAGGFHVVLEEGVPISQALTSGSLSIASVIPYSHI